MFMLQLYICYIYKLSGQKKRHHLELTKQIGQKHPLDNYCSDYMFQMATRYFIS